MRSHKKSHLHQSWFRLALIACLALGILGYAPTIAPGNVALADPPPPSPEQVAEDQPMLDAQSPRPTSSAAQRRERKREAEIRAALAALEAAREAGPEAVVALLDILRGEALDLVMDEIVEAQEQLAEMAPPRPATRPISLAEERAVLQAQRIVAAANRARALAPHDELAKAAAPTVHYSPPTVPTRPATDLTVGSDPCEYTTIAGALAVAQPGDRLLLEGGRTFTENLTLPISLTLQGGYDGCGSGSTAPTTIDGSNATNRVVQINAGLSVTLESLIITNGSVVGFESGGGINFASGSGTLNLAHVDIYTNTAFVGGGLWVGENAEVVGTDVEIYENWAAGGGGVYLFGGRATFSGTCNIRDNRATSGGGVYGVPSGGYAPALDLPSSADVYDNQALTGEGQGGGVYMRQGSLSLADGSDIAFNDAIDGGGAYLVTSTLTINGSASEIQNNTATGEGGGVFAVGSTINLDDNAELISNYAGPAGPGVGFGGGAYLDGSILWSDRASIRHNTADNHGGGVYATNGSKVDMDLENYTCLGSRCSQLSNNTAQGAHYGGGIYADGSDIDLRNIFIEDNSAQYGGGIYASDSTVVVYNSLFAENDATAADAGDGIRLYTGASMTGAGITLADNDAGGASTGEAIGMLGASLTLDCSIIWGHDTSINYTAEAVTYSDIQGTVTYIGTGNINQDPQFVNPSSDDYHLPSSGSPALDKCQYFYDMSTDFDNESRPILRTTPASPYDMGADEASVPRVGINGGGCAHSTIQRAINAANSGDTIQLATDTYYEVVDINSGQAITIEGRYDSTCITTTGTATTIDGSYHSGSTVDVSGSTVTLRGLEVVGGDGTGGGVDAGSNARVTLDNTDVHDNNGSYGGGVYVSSSSAMTITNNSDIYANTATSHGGGAHVAGRFFGLETLSDITSNSAPHGGGFYVPGGTLYLNGSDLGNNEATDATGKGGGIYVTSGGVVTLTDGVQIYNDHGAYDGAGIYADNATVYLEGPNTAIRDNIATNYGGGVYLTNNSTLHSAGASIGQTGSTLANEAKRGAGIYAVTSTVNFVGSSMINNVASDRGAGIYADASTLNLTDATVGGTGTDEANQLGPSGYYGVGLYLANGTRATLSNTVVASNTFQSTALTSGGGAFVMGGSVLTLTNSRIERHLAPSTSGGRGAGIYVYNSTVTLDNSQVISNIAGTNGGGVRLYDASTLNILNGSSISNNKTLNGEGGGIAATDMSTITISNSTLQYNTASTDGGAIYAENSSLIQCNGAEFGESDNGNRAMAGNGNRATAGNGGAIYLNSSDFNAANCTFRNSQAGTDGGAIAAYTSTLMIDADYSSCDPLANQCSRFYGNTADSDGDNNGNGGALYVENSTLRVDHTYLHRNSARLGGVIYQVGTGATTQISNSLIYSNTASSTAGAAVRVYEGDFTVTHVTLANNTGAPAFSARTGTSSAAHNSIAWGNSDGGFEGTFVITTCNIDQSGIVGIVADPRFVAPGAGEDYHLGGGSPAVDACVTGLSPDLDNVSRPLDSGYDMGAYEGAAGSSIYLPLVMRNL